MKLLVWSELPPYCLANYSLSSTKPSTERALLNVSLMNRFGLGDRKLFTLTASASPGGARKSCTSALCVSLEGSFLDEWRDAAPGRYTLLYGDKWNWRGSREVKNRINGKGTHRAVEVIYDSGHFYCCPVTDFVLLIDYIFYDVWV